MINIDKLLASKRVVITFPETKIDKDFVKQFRANNNLTQATLANILGVTKKSVEKWEQGVNKIGGSSAVLLKLLNNNSALLSQLYNVQCIQGKRTVEEYVPIESKIINLTTTKPSKISLPLVAVF